MTNNKVNTDTVMSTGAYVLAFILMSLPVIGLILCIVWAFVSCSNLNRRNLARACLILMIIGIVFSLIIVILSAAFTSSFGGLMETFNLLNGLKD